MPFRSTYVRPRWFQWDSYYWIFRFMCMFCRSLFVLLSFFFWPLSCLSFFDLRILKTPLVSSNSSYIQDYITQLQTIDGVCKNDDIMVGPRTTGVLIATRKRGEYYFGRDILPLPCNGLPTTTPNKLLLIRNYSMLSFTGLYVQIAWQSLSSFISQGAVVVVMVW